ncbi:hypothetical protein LCGC14_0672860 [marine sediment metagenome]|uniref:DOD-type homing endonuclease domain-containing protein n=1 Tax=marine sediment metagenome TaxID=412755 RepID=A0A0F9TBW8_9ZZZZ
MVVKKKIKAYGYDAEFERIIAVMSATNPRFYGRVGSSIDARGLRVDEVKLVLKAVAAIAKKIGKGPTHESVVIQRIRRWVHQGKETQEDLDEVIDLFLDAPELPTEEEVVGEVAPMLKRRMQAEAVRLAMDEYAKHGDMGPVVKIINQAVSLGEQDSSLGMRLGPSALKEIKRLRQLDRLPINIPELDAALGGGLPRGCINIWLGGENSGKCHAKGQGILMYSGATKKVEDIAVGDLVCGPDGPKQVLSLARGHDQMYDIVPKRGSSWRVNAAHLLTIVDNKTGVIKDVSVQDYLEWSGATQRRHYLLRSGAMFAPRKEPLLLDPYILGVILGDGSTLDKSVTVTTADPEIVAELQGCADENGLRLSIRAERGLATTYGLAGTAGKKNPVAAALETYGVRFKNSGSKFIPEEYKRAEAWIRRDVLAGLIDTDGSCAGYSYDYISKSEQLTKDVVFLARSIGLSATWGSTKKRCQTGAVGTYYRAYISGQISRVPCRVLRKRVLPLPRFTAAGKRTRDPLVTGFSVIRVGTEDYYGFNLGGDGRYLLDDFTVTHNSMALSHVVANTVSLGYCAVAATLELSEAAWQARVIANLLEYPINEIMEGDQKGLARRLRKKKIGPLWVKDFPPKLTTILDIWRWVIEVEEYEGIPVDLVAIDYINKIKSHDRTDKSQYEGQGTAIETYRHLIAETGKWGHTAGQAQRRTVRDRKRRIEGQDVAESMHLVRVPDLGISLNPDDETGEVTYYIARNRNGPKGITVGPIPHDFACGSMTYGA